CIVKKTYCKEYANIRKTGIQAITLRDNDELIEVKATDSTKEIFLVTKYGYCIRFKETDVRPTGRSAMGVIGMNILEGDEVVGMQLNTQGDTLLIVSENGLGKRTPIEEFNLQNRGGKGVKCYKINEKSGNVIGVKAVSNTREIMLITTEGIIIRMEVAGISTLGRITSGVKLINLDDGVKVAKVAKVREEDVSDETESEENNNEDSEDNSEN
ncbi:DNA gyrase C-terminal beta-propeller domain-containing protein, partial [Eshraghiella crossota]|uniref:DNA gyrase C-terminal beta-propeller domain-containing protein n=1 Tax=Eshraghiella crossota TaxID=45851 RepID=UPI003FD7B2F9